MVILIINIIGGKYKNQIFNSLIDEIKKEISDSENGGKLTTFLDEIYGRFENEDSAENIQRLLLFIKVALNKNILENVEPEEIIDYLNTPSREKLLKIVEIVFSNEAKTILEERPRLDIKNIPNLYIFNKEIMNEFSFGDIHNFLSYNNKGVKIITDLVRYPVKMQSYKVFSKITSQYFANTPQDLEKKLLAFSFFNELAFELCNHKGNLSEKCIKNLHLMLDDFSTDRFKILPVKVKSIEELESYDKTREKMVDDAIKKLTDIELVKEIILQCYFNPADMCKKEELTRFRTFLSKEEIDYLEKRFEIKNMNDLDSLKKEYENLKEKKEDFIKKRMSKIGNKIKKHYDELMVSSLLLPEDAAKRARMGEPGISVVEEDGLEIITLSGADIYLYISNLEAGHMSQNPETTTIDDKYKRWTELEEGTSTISGCIFGKYNFKHIEDNTKNYWVGFSDFSADQIVSFGIDDINTAHEKKCLKPSAESTDSRNTPKEITKKANYNKNGPELAIFRRKKDSRSIKKGTYGGRIMPTYVFATKEDYTEQKATYIYRAKDFGVKYIIVLDKEAYKDIDKSIDYDTEKEQK